MTGSDAEGDEGEDEEQDDLPSEQFPDTVVQLTHVHGDT
jgi:hypothetical protein